MYKAATYLSSGSELLLLEIMGPGIIGGLFLPILGALPDAILILGTSSSFDVWTYAFGPADPNVSSRSTFWILSFTTRSSGIFLLLFVNIEIDWVRYSLFCHLDPWYVFCSFATGYARGKWEDYWIFLSFVCFLGCCCPSRSKVLAFVSVVEWMDCYRFQRNHLGLPKGFAQGWPRVRLSFAEATV